MSLLQENRDYLNLDRKIIVKCKENIPNLEKDNDYLEFREQNNSSKYGKFLW
jgi:hypothetical protein